MTAGKREMVRKLNRHKGSAMIVALVVCTVVMTFCLTLLLVTYTLFSQTSRQNGQMQCKNMAQSFSECLEIELADEHSDLVKLLNERMKSTDPALRWQAVDADDTNDPNFDENAMTELKLAVTQVVGYQIRIYATYEMAEEAEEPAPAVSSDASGDAEEDDRETSPQATFTITCIKGDGTGPDVISYSVVSRYTIPALETN